MRCAGSLAFLGGDVVGFVLSFARGLSSFWRFAYLCYCMAKAYGRPDWVLVCFFVFCLVSFAAFLKIMLNTITYIIVLSCFPLQKSNKESKRAHLWKTRLLIIYRRNSFFTSG